MFLGKFSKVLTSAFPRWCFLCIMHVVCVCIKVTVSQPSKKTYAVNFPPVFPPEMSFHFFLYRFHKRFWGLSQATTGASSVQKQWKVITSVFPTVMLTFYRITSLASIWNHKLRLSKMPRHKGRFVDKRRTRSLQSLCRGQKGENYYREREEGD